MNLDREERQLVAELGALLGGAPQPPPEGLDGQRFEALCDEHKVAAAIARAPGAPSRPNLQRLHLEGFGRAAVVERRRGEVVAALADRGLDLLVLKGADWAFRIYPDPGMRPMVDVDVLAPPGRAADVVEALQDVGYHVDPAEAGLLERGFTVGMYPAEAPKLRIEVHTALCRPTRHPIDVAELFARSAPLTEDGPGRRMNDVDGLLYCAIHHGLHGYRMPLLWLLDFALLAQACGPDEALVARARAWGARRVLATSRRLAEELWGPLPLAQTQSRESGYLQTLIRTDHLQMNRFSQDRQARISSALSLRDRGRLAYLFDSLARRIRKK